MTYLLPSLQNPNVSKSNDIQSLKQYIDLQGNQLQQHIGGIEETLKKLTHTIEKYVVSSFPSHEVVVKPMSPKTSAAKGSSQTPLYGIRMNTCATSS
jgi:hypothetical protein